MNKLNKIFENLPEWVDNDIVVCSSTYMRRNISGKVFPRRSKSQLEDGLSTFDLIKCLPVIKSYNKVANYSGVSVQREGLMERGLATPYFNELDLPGSHVLISPNHKNSILINEMDHLVFIGIESGFNFDSSLNAVKKMVNIVGEAVEYSYHNKYGYLNSFLENCGSGTRLSVKMFVPAIFFEGRGKDINKIITNYKCLLHGSFGEGSNIEGGNITICNASDRLVEQELLIDNVKQAVSKIYELELECRDNMRNNYDHYSNDVLSSFGAMSYQTRTTFEEALKFLPLIYVGAILGMFSEEAALKLRKLMFSVSPAELSMHNGEKIGKDNLIYLRANLISDTLRALEIKR